MLSADAYRHRSLATPLSHRRAPVRAAIGIARKLAYVGWFFLCNLDRMLLPGKLHRTSTIIRYSRGILRPFKIKPHFHGTIPAQQGVMLAGNHLSYIDVLILLSHNAPLFLARADLWQWPVIKRMLRSHESLPMSRNRKELPDRIHKISQFMAAGKNLILFAEATTSNGRNLIPFNSGIFLATKSCMRQHIDMVVQPFTIRLDKIAGVPRTRALDAFFAWHDDMSLLGHVSALALLPAPMDIRVIFHPPIADRDILNSPREVTEHAETACHEGMHSLL